jgi:nucleoid-associated protein YgaU
VSKFYSSFLCAAEKIDSELCLLFFGGFYMRLRMFKPFGMLTLVAMVSLFNSCASSSEGDEDIEASSEEEVAEEPASDESNLDGGELSEESVASEEAADSVPVDEVASEEVQPAEIIETDSSMSDLASETTSSESIETYDMESASPTSGAGLEQDEVAAIPEPYPETTEVEEQLIDTAEKIESDSYASPQPVVSESPKSTWQPESRPANANLGEYVVVPNDTLGSIAERIYGSARQWQKLADVSELSNPNRIFPGDVIYFEKTGKGKDFAKEYKNMPRSKVTVARGDTLAEISKRVFGSEHLWKVLWKYNRKKISNPNRIYAGMTLSYIEMGGMFSSGESAQNKAESMPESQPQVGETQQVETAAPSDQPSAEQPTEQQPSADTDSAPSEPEQAH